MKLTHSAWGHFVFILSFLLLSCSENNDKVKEEKISEDCQTIIPPSNLRLDQICRTYASNDFVGLLGMMHNYKDKPAAYQKQLINMLKQRDAERQKKSMRISHIHPSRVILHPSGKVADIFLDISYNDNLSEVIMVPLIYDQGKWWIK